MKDDGGNDDSVRFRLESSYHEEQPPLVLSGPVRPKDDNHIGFLVCDGKTWQEGGLFILRSIREGTSVEYGWLRDGGVQEKSRWLRPLEAPELWFQYLTEDTGGSQLSLYGFKKVDRDLLTMDISRGGISKTDLQKHATVMAFQTTQEWVDEGGARLARKELKEGMAIASRDLVQFRKTSGLLFKNQFIPFPTPQTAKVLVLPKSSFRSVLPPRDTSTLLLEDRFLLRAGSRIEVEETENKISDSLFDFDLWYLADGAWKKLGRFESRDLEVVERAAADR